MRDPDLAVLEAGPEYRFADWADSTVPSAAAGLYTIWDEVEFIYVGMAGRGKSEQQIAQDRDEGRRSGIWNRLNSHASGRRSGDQFCVYVCDRMVLPALTQGQIDGVARGDLSLDALIRDYVQDRFTYRWLETANGAVALDVEREVQEGALSAGKPLLNPRGV